MLGLILGWSNTDAPVFWQHLTNCSFKKSYSQVGPIFLVNPNCAQAITALESISGQLVSHKNIILYYTCIYPSFFFFFFAFGAWKEAENTQSQNSGFKLWLWKWMKTKPELKKEKFALKTLHRKKLYWKIKQILKIESKMFHACLFSILCHWLSVSVLCNCFEAEWRCFERKGQGECI